MPKDIGFIRAFAGGNIIRVLTDPERAFLDIHRRFGDILPPEFYIWLLQSEAGETYTLRDGVGLPEFWVNATGPNL